MTKDEATAKAREIVKELSVFCYQLVTYSAYGDQARGIIERALLEAGTRAEVSDACKTCGRPNFGTGHVCKNNVFNSTPATVSVSDEEIQKEANEFRLREKEKKAEDPTYCFGIGSSFEAGARWMRSKLNTPPDSRLDKVREGLNLGDWSAVSGAVNYQDFASELLALLPELPAQKERE